MRGRKRSERWEVGQYKCLGLSHKKNMCPQVLLFSDMDISTMSWAEGRAEGLCGLRKDMAYHQASSQL